MRCKLFSAALALAVLAAPLHAQTAPDGVAPDAIPAPRTGGGLGSILHVTASVERDRGGLADIVTAPEGLRLVLQAVRAADRASVSVKLTCRIAMVTDKGPLPPLMEETCLEGDVPGGGMPVPLWTTFTFRPGEKTPNATYGFEVLVTDSVSGESVTLRPSWRWEGGQG